MIRWIHLQAAFWADSISFPQNPLVTNATFKSFANLEEWMP
jgi:hypothetical protein